MLSSDPKLPWRSPRWDSIELEGRARPGAQRPWCALSLPPLRRGVAGVAVIPPPAGVRMAWESASCRAEEKPRPRREILLAKRGRRGGGEIPGRHRRGSRERMAERREKHPGHRGQGRNGRADGAGERGRSDPGSHGRRRLQGTPCRDSGPRGGCRASPEAGPGRTAAAQVAEPGGGASSPSPRPAAMEGGGGA